MPGAGAVSYAAAREFDSLPRYRVKKKPRLSRNLKRAAKVAIGAGSLYLAGRGLSQVSEAAESGSIVKLVKGLAKLGSVRSLGESGVKSVLDGLKGEDEDDDD